MGVGQAGGPPRGWGRASWASVTLRPVPSLRAGFRCPLAGTLGSARPIRFLAVACFWLLDGSPDATFPSSCWSTCGTYCNSENVSNLEDFFGGGG